MPEPQTLIEAVRHFSDLGICFRYMVALKWPDDRIICPKCGGDKIGSIVTRCMLQCKGKNSGFIFAGFWHGSYMMSQMDSYLRLLTGAKLRCAVGVGGLNAT